MTSRFLSGVNGTGGHLHDFPSSLSGRTALYTTGGGAATGKLRSSSRGSWNASIPGIPVFGGACEILGHRGDQLFHRSEDPIVAEPRQEIGRQPLAAEGLVRGIVGEMH